MIKDLVEKSVLVTAGAMMLTSIGCAKEQSQAISAPTLTPAPTISPPDTPIDTSKFPRINEEIAYTNEGGFWNEYKTAEAIALLHLPGGLNAPQTGDLSLEFNPKTFIGYHHEQLRKGGLQMVIRLQPELSGKAFNASLFVGSPNEKQTRSALGGKLTPPPPGDNLKLEVAWIDWAFKRLTWAGDVVFPPQPNPAKTSKTV